MLLPMLYKNLIFLLVKKIFEMFPMQIRLVEYRLKNLISFKRKDRKKETTGKTLDANFEGKPNTM